MVDKSETYYDLEELLTYIDPTTLDYTEWLNVGMALKDAGYTCDIWDAWSRRDSGRYHSGECWKKWDSFRGASAPVTAGTIVQMARESGWTPPRAEGHEVAWDDVLDGGGDDRTVVKEGWVEGLDVQEPAAWRPAEQLITYLEALFNDDERVGYVTESWENDGKMIPTSGCFDRTAGELVAALRKCKDDIGAVLGDAKPEAGAWIRFNPLDGKGVRNDNVTDYRYALVESDEIDVAQQNAILRELELPIAALVHSGKKSLHAIVRVEAPDYEEYRRRVEYLYDVCRKNGLKPDKQNKNPSRLSRMPGVVRGGHKQFLIATNIGKASWAEWKEWIESVNDNLPDPESLETVWNDMPELSPPLIDGMLRVGHKMLLAGPSKAGKSFALIELCIAIAEGMPWLGFPCRKGKVFYVNFELDRASCFHRFRDVYDALGWEPENIKNICIWNLRGSTVPMDKLAPKLIRRAQKENFAAVVIDPIYKVLTGDENSADQMAQFCNQFDRVCHELGAAVIYCHHHSKGNQGSKKSIDRSSGSGVFARDPDAILDLVQLETTPELMEQTANRAACNAMTRWLDDCVDGWRRDVGPDDRLSVKAFTAALETLLPKDRLAPLLALADVVQAKTAQRTAWRIEGTLREFPKFPPVNVWFDYPVHLMDDTGALKDISPEGEVNSKGSPWKRNFAGRKTAADRKAERRAALDTAFDALNFDGEVDVAEMAEFMGTTAKTVYNRLKEHGGFQYKEGVVTRKGKGKTR